MLCLDDCLSFAAGTQSRVSLSRSGDRVKSLCWNFKGELRETFVRPEPSVSPCKASDRYEVQWSHDQRGQNHPAPTVTRWRTTILAAILLPRVPLPRAVGPLYCRATNSTQASTKRSANREGSRRSGIGPSVSTPNGSNYLRYRGTRVASRGEYQ